MGKDVELEVVLGSFHETARSPEGKTITLRKMPPPTLRLFHVRR